MRARIRVALASLAMSAGRPRRLRFARQAERPHDRVAGSAGPFPDKNNA